ncbi:MAG: hypothetical protein QM500_04440 [Methylococcales bacterium]
MKSSRRSFIKKVLGSCLIAVSPYYSNANAHYELFDKFQPNENIFVFGLGDNGSKVISMCKRLSLKGLNYISSYNGISKRMLLDHESVNPVLIFLVVNGSDANQVSAAASLIQDVKEKDSVIVTLLTTNYKGINKRDSSNDMLQELVRTSDSIIDFPSARDVSEFDDFKLNSNIKLHVDAIYALTQPIFRNSYIGIDYGDILFFIRNASYIRNFTLSISDYNHFDTCHDILTNANSESVGFSMAVISSPDLVLSEVQDVFEQLSSHKNTIVTPLYDDFALEKRVFLFGIEKKDTWGALQKERRFNFDVESKLV